MDFTVLADHRDKTKEGKIQDEYLSLVREVMKLSQGFKKNTLE